MVADGAVSAEAAGARAGAAFGAGGGAAEAIGGGAARRAAAAMGVFFLATAFDFFGGFTACRVT